MLFFPNYLCFFQPFCHNFVSPNVDNAVAVVFAVINRNLKIQQSRKLLKYNMKDIDEINI